jgi:hypothetical protein
VRLIDIPPARDAAIIINVGTKWISTLALMSALRFLSMPVTLIDCDSHDGSIEHFSRLRAQHDFSVVRLPLRPHGLTLDSVFSELRAERVWLLDSDAEILGPAVVDMMQRGLADDRTFGAGFRHGPEWLTPEQTGYGRERMGLYAERMWIPFTALKRGPVLDALSSGLSFRDTTIFNEFPRIPFVSRLMHRRLKTPGLQSLRLDVLKPLRRIYGDEQPHYVYSDTGAEVYRHLVRLRGMLFCGLDARLAGPYVSHFHGLTRARLNSRDRNVTSLASVRDVIAQRLGHYGFNGVEAGDI